MERIRQYYKRASARAKDAPCTTWLAVFLAIISLIRVIYIYNGPLDLSPDEAVYWEYSRRPAMSYYEKGPLIAWLIYLSTAIFGNNSFGVRVTAVVLSLLSSIFVFKSGKRLYDEKTGVLSAVLLQLVPLFNAQAILMTIDAPYLFFWTLSFYIFLKAIDARDVKAGAGWWAVLGLTVGLGLLAKNTMVFFIIAAFLYLLFNRTRRQQLLGPWPYIGLVVSMVVFSPVILWNASNGWIMFKHEAGHANLGSGLTLNTGMLLNYVGSQLGVITPVLLIMMIIAVIKIRKETQGSLLFWFSAPVLVFFLIKSLQGKVQGNWPMAGYITCIIAFCAYYLKEYDLVKGARKYFIIAALIISTIITVISYYPPMIGLTPKMDPSSRLRGWALAAAEVSKIRAIFNDEAFVFSDNYQVSAEMAFYMQDNPVTYCINLGRRMNQYDLWPGPEKYKGQTGIFVSTHNSLPVPVAQAFEGCSKKKLKLTERGYKLRDYSIFTCRNFRGSITQEKPHGF
jgi:undecaprenyl-diphosphatase